MIATTSLFCEARASHDELVELGRKWLFNNQRCAVVLTEPRSLNMLESPDVLGFDYGACSTVIECKTSRSDFLADSKKWFRKRPEIGMGTYRWYLCPDGVIGENDLPDCWGLLVVRDGKRGPIITKIRNAQPQPGNIHNERALLVQALRRIVNPISQGINVRTFVPIQTEKPCAMRQSLSVRPLQEAIL